MPKQTSEGLSSPSITIPGWETKQLSEVCEIERGGSPRPIDSFLTNDPSGVNWIKIGDTKGITKYIYQTQEKIRPEGARRSRLVVEGDFILSNSMSFGRPYIMKTTGCIHDGWLLLRPKEPRINQDFLYYVLGSDLIFRQFDSLAAGSTVRNLNIGLVKTVRVPVPPQREQERIVAILDEVFEGVERAQAVVRLNLINSRAILDGALQSLLERDTHAAHVCLDSVCEISSMLIDPREPLYVDLPHVGAGNIESRTGVLRDVHTAREEGLISGKFVFDKTMVLYSKIRPYLEKATRPDFRGLCSADMYPLKPLNGKLTRDFLFYILLSHSFTKYAIAGSARSGMPKVNRDHLFKYRFRLPSVPEQNRITEKLDSLKSETERLDGIYKQKQVSLEDLKQSLLQQAFSDNL